MDKSYYVEVVRHGTNEVAQRLGPYSKRQAGKADSGINSNLNHAAFSTRIVSDSKTEFYRAFGEMPECICGGFDPCAHTSIADLVNIARHELDLYQEGEETDITSAIDEDQVKKFISKWEN